MPKYIVHATVTKEATFSVVAADEEEAVQKMNSGGWLEQTSEDQVTGITANRAEEDTA
jgi:hypothetical protein